MVSMGWPTAVASTPAAAPVTKCDIVRYLFEAATLRCLGPCEAGAYFTFGLGLQGDAAVCFGPPRGNFSIAHQQPLIAPSQGQGWRAHPGPVAGSLTEERRTANSGRRTGPPVIAEREGTADQPHAALSIARGAVRACWRAGAPRARRVLWRVCVCLLPPAGAQT
jgi:hypothetical protein